ncbi:MAG: thioredoxin family protein [Candidatus Levybacteria bacterium]|nr:thioredoxin family protein [Candidatus Levybacteria bacterium]
MTIQNKISNGVNKTQIQILYFPDCPIYKELEKLVQETIKELKIKASLELVNIQTKEDAEKYHFTGSPGLLINGKNIDSLAKDAPVVLRSCKIYRTEEGMKMMPTKKMVIEALLETRNKNKSVVKDCC